MQGPLQEIGLAEVLQLLARGRRHGLLRVVGADPSRPRLILVHDGVVAAIDPDAEDAAVIRALAARFLQDPHGGEPPTVAVREGMRQILARRSLLEMLTWQRGEFVFEESAPIPGPLHLPIDTLLRTLVDAEHRRDDLEAVLPARSVPDFPADSAVSPTTLPPLDPFDWRLLDAVDGVRTVTLIAERLDESIDEVQARILALVRAAILEIRSAPVAVDVAARAAVESGRYDDAVARLRDRVTSVPEDDEAWRLLGLAEVGAGRFDQAVAAWRSWQAVGGPRAAEATTLIQAARTMLEALRDHRD